ncbi:MAG: cystinosin [Bacillariaceae sp.]|jgi:cystinosin
MSNFKRRSTVGLSADFCVLNVLGFGCYTAYNASFFWSTTIHEYYKQRYGPNAEITVQSNDVAFAIHALILSSITLCQIAYYGDEPGIRSIKLSKPTKFIIVFILSVCAVYPLLVVTHRGRANVGYEDDAIGRFNWLDYLYILSFVKIFISLIKYIPQVILNFKRKSTVGWSIWNILLDFTGGMLSDLQLFLDCINLNDFRSISRNLAKFGLGWLSIIFDLIFLVQHYCLYSSQTVYDSAEDTIQSNQNEPLLPAVENDVANEGGEEELQEQGGPLSEPAQPQTIFV